MKGLIYVLEFIQEVALPKLSQTSLFIKFNETSELAKHVNAELANAAKTRVAPDKLTEIISLIKLNGDPIAKKAIKSLESGEIIILNSDKGTSQIPPALPFIIVGKNNKSFAVIFAQVFIDNIQSSNEYTKLMAVIEASYLALRIQEKPGKYIGNRPLMLSFCNLYCDMVTAPIEQKRYVKGENLTKMRLFAMAYFYRMIDGDEEYKNNTMHVLPNIAKRVVLDKVEPSLIKTIGETVAQMSDMNFMSLIELFKTINPSRYEVLGSVYMNDFVSVSGMPLIFALENIQYLCLLLTSSAYKTNLTGFGLNKLVSMVSKKAIALLSSSV